MLLYCDKYVCYPRLLDVLAGRKDPAGLEGHVLIDGRPQPKNFKCISGYVVQVGYCWHNNTTKQYSCKKIIV